MLDREKFKAGDFVVLNRDDDVFVGIVCGVFVKGSEQYFFVELDVWFGEFGDGGLPITYRVSSNRVELIKGARHARPFLPEPGQKLPRKNKAPGTKRCETST